MKPDLLKMAMRTMERFVVVILVAPALRWLFTGTIVVPWATVVCVMAAVVLYDVWRFALDARRHEAKEKPPTLDGPPKLDGTAWLPGILVVPLLAIAATVALQCLRPEPSGPQPHRWGAAMVARGAK